MTFNDWFTRSEALRRDTAHARPAHFFFLEAARHAAVLALVLVVADATPWSFQQGRPWVRVWFLVSWSATMAGWSVYRVRSRLGGRATGA